ncbi:MAG TPA: MoxR family ATPase [Acidimicrobiales bacterium]|nr:MoxR family ATPase [Acidimicrobiales bacterium]
MTAAPEPRPLSLAEVGELATAILDEVDRAIVGKRDAVGLVLLGVLAGGHILLEDVPGVAKTLAARSLCQATGLSYSRIQFTPDLMPADVTGSSFYDARRAELEFRPGPLFANLVLGDEINRAPPKTQAALLEAMQEHQVTADGTTHALPEPFAVIATQNPIEYEGTYPLPEAQLDRFLLRVSIGYPDRAGEEELVQRRARRGREDAGLRPVTDAAGVLRMQAAVERVEIAQPVAGYLVDLVRATREMSGVQVGASPRASVALLQASRARAALCGRDYVLPDDVKAVAEPCLAHRLCLQPEMWLRGVQPAELVRRCLATVPVPVAIEPEGGAGATAAPASEPPTGAPDDFGAGVVSPA